MRSHWTPVLMLAALALAACQPSPAPAQTQSAQSAFDTAVAAAGTQAAPPATPLPTATPPASQPPLTTAAATSSRPVATLDAAVLRGLASRFQDYLDGEVSRFQPGDSAPYVAQVVFVEYEYYDNDRAAVMDVGIQKSDDTREGLVQVAVLNAFIQMYAPDPNLLHRKAWSEVLDLPVQLRVFRVHIYDSTNHERFRLTGNWEDVVAYGKGSLTKDDFWSRLTFEKAAE